MIVMDPRFHEAIPSLISDLDAATHMIEQSLDKAHDIMAVALNHVEAEIETCERRLSNFSQLGESDQDALEAEHKRLRILFYAKRTFSPDNAISPVFVLHGIKDFLREIIAEDAERGALREGIPNSIPG